MAIRITKTTDGRQTLLKVDGRLQGEDLEELTQACRPAPANVSLDLTELLSADRAGVAVLQELVSLGAEVRAASPYIALLLKAGLDAGKAGAG